MLLVADVFIIITFCFRRRKEATNAPVTPNTPASTPTIIKSLWDFFFLIAGRWAGGRARGETGGGWAGGGGNGGGWAWGGGTGGGWAWGGRIAGEPVGGLSPLLNGEGGGKRKSKEDSGEDNGGGGEGNGGGGEAFPNPGSWPGGASWSSLRPLDVKGNGWPKLLSHKSKTSSSCKSATSLGTSPENELFLRILHNKKGNCLILVSTTYSLKGAGNTFTYRDFKWVRFPSSGASVPWRERSSRFLRIHNKKSIYRKKKLRKMNYIRTLFMSDLQDDDSSIMWTDNTRPRTMRKLSPIHQSSKWVSLYSPFEFHQSQRCKTPFQYPHPSTVE